MAPKELKIEKYNYFKELFKTISISLFLYTNASIIGTLFFFRWLFDKIALAGWITVVFIFSLVDFSALWILFKPIKNVKSKSVGYFDQLLVSSFVGLFICWALSRPQTKIIAKNGGYFSEIVIGLIAFFVLALIVTRSIIVSKQKACSLYACHVKDYQNIDNIPNDKNKCILIDEAVDYDLLGRDYILNRIKSSFASLQKGGALAITGEWGSGKTTLLKSALRDAEKDGFYVCNDVSAWDYSSDKLFFVAIINRIYKALNIGKDNKIIHAAFERYVSTLMSTNNVSYLQNLFNFDSPDDSSFLTIISNYLKNNNKHIIFVIDDLDRATDEVALFTYKVIVKNLHIENVLFVCLFDEERIEKSLKRSHLEYAFLEKVFAITIRVPNPDTASLQNIALRCLNNFLTKHYKDQVDEFDETDKKIIRTVIKLCGNLRVFIILFNTISNILSLNG